MTKKRDILFFFAMLKNTIKRSWFLFSVSKTSDPEGEWVFYALDMQLKVECVKFSGQIFHEWHWMKMQFI